MKKIFINGLSAKAGGGKSILTNYLSLLSESKTDDRYIVLVPDKNTYKEFNSFKIEVIHLPSPLSTKVFFPFIYSIILPILLKKKKVAIIFNLADIPIVTSIKQIFLFDWPYAVYPKSEVWKMMGTGDYIVKKIKLYFFVKYSKYIDVLIAQTDTMRIHLNSIYGIQNIKVVPNAVSLDNLSDGILKNYVFPLGLKFLYLTHYYPHKNIEIFLDIAKHIKTEKLDFKLIITIDPKQHKAAKKILLEIKRLELEEIIINIGAVEMEHVPSLYKQIDALLMPTLLESFSGTYVEAMFHKKPILTSKYDFAFDVCQNAAIYFNPHNAEEILYSMKGLADSIQKRDSLVVEGSNVLARMPNWDETFMMYNKIIKSLI
jgi:glycosyltransferase involved in cell wall biosynthesis